MSELSNEQLALLDTLMYLDNNDEKGIIGIANEKNKNKSLGRYLDTVDIDNIDAAEVNDDGTIKSGIANITRNDWKDIIAAAKNDPQISNLVIKSTLPDSNKKGAVGVCFVDSDKQATVAFRGTGPCEWLDNGETGYSSDTEQQTRASDWVNSLDYNNITTIGHSKGGNKAEYVTIVTDKVARCVAFDSPGFSQEFCDKYQDEITAKKDRISLIAPQDGYVCNLFFNIAGNTTFYESTCSTIDKFSNVKINLISLISKLTSKSSDITDKVPKDLLNAGITIGRAHMPNSFYSIADGKVEFHNETNQDSVMKILHDYIEYIDVNATTEDKEYFFEFLMNKIQNEEGRVELGNPPDGFYDRILDLSKNWISTLNLTDEQKKEFKDIIINITKGKNESVDLSALLSAIANQATETTITSLQNTIRDFRPVTRERVANNMKDVEGDDPIDFLAWAQWEALADNIKSRLDIESYRDSIDKYYKYLIDKNGTSIVELNRIFDKACEIDERYSSKLKPEIEKLQNVKDGIIKLTSRFNPTLA